MKAGAECHVECGAAQAHSAVCAAKMAPKKKYIGRFACLEEDGPPVFVPVFSHPRGRWHDEFSLQTHVVARDVVRNRLRNCGLSLEACLDIADNQWHLEGFVVMSAWHLTQATGTAFCAADSASIQSSQVLQNMLLSQCSAGIRAVLEFPILAACFLREPLRCGAIGDIDMENYAVALDKPSFAQKLWSDIPPDTPVFEMDSMGLDSTELHLSKLWAKWCRQYRWPLLGPQNVLAGWRVWRPLGKLMCRLQWAADAVAIVQRVKGRFAVRLRNDSPPAKLVREYLEYKAR
eukprot:871517-Amphidinium_carterae.2